MVKWYDESDDQFKFLCKFDIRSNCHWHQHKSFLHACTEMTKHDASWQHGLQLYVQGHEVAHLDHPRTQMCTCLAQSSDVDGGLEHAGVTTESLA